ncbi:MAG: sulfotransferase domain-containing protein [Pseudomonadota bacterium]
MAIDKSATAAHSKKVRTELWTNFSVRRHFAFDGMLVTSKNSGTHWIKYMLAVALADHHGVPEPQYFSEQAVRPYIGWPKDKPTFPELPRLAFSHTIPHRLMDWAIARQHAGLPKYVLAIRHPMAILASHYAKWSHELDVDWITFLKGDPSGQRYRCDIYWLARFWNRWGELVHKDPSRFLIVKYENTREDPEAALRQVSKHWQLHLADAAIETALLSGSKDAMAKKTDPHAEINVLQNREERLEDQFSGESMDLYQSMAANLFANNLGYDLCMHPKPVRASL